MDTGNAQQPEEANSPQAGTLAPRRTSSLVSMILAVAAGVGVWFLIQTYYPVFTIPAELRALGMGSTPEQWEELARETASARQRNTILALAVLGSGLGIALGLAAGLVRRSLKLAVIAAVAAGILGCLFGGLGGLLADSTFVAIKPAAGQISLTGTSIVQIVSLGLLGAGIGLGLGLVLGSSQPTIETVLYGLVAGAVAGLLCCVATALLLPKVPTIGAIPVGATDDIAKARLLWIVLTALMLGLLLPMAGGKRRSDAS